MTPSPKYSLNKEDLIKITTAFGFSLASATVAFLILTVEQIDFAQYTFLVPIINIALYSAKRYLEGD